MRKGERGGGGEKWTRREKEEGKGGKMKREGKGKTKENRERGKRLTALKSVRGHC